MDKNKAKYPPLNIYYYHLSKILFFLKYPFGLKGIVVLGFNNFNDTLTTSYLKINGIMCCIVLKYLYLCVIKLRIKKVKAENPERSYHFLTAILIKYSHETFIKLMLFLSSREK